MRRTLVDMEVTDRRAALLHFLDGATTDELADLKAALAEVEARAEDADRTASDAESSRPGRRRRRDPRNPVGPGRAPVTMVP